MFTVNATSRRSMGLALALLLLTVLAWGAAQPAAADPGPCSAVVNGPKPPIEDPDPDAAGRVTDDTSSPISGATMELFQCDSGTATSQGTTTTNANGDYVFEDLTPEYYYMEAQMTGPLTGMNSSDGTDNPSDAVGLGDSVTDLDFVFE